MNDGLMTIVQEVASGRENASTISPALWREICIHVVETRKPPMRKIEIEAWAIVQEGTGYVLRVREDKPAGVAGIERLVRLTGSYETPAVAPVPDDPMGDEYMQRLSELREGQHR